MTNLAPEIAEFIVRARRRGSSRAVTAEMLKFYFPRANEEQIEAAILLAVEANDAEVAQDAN
ncbi:hypothetical protein [Rhizobium sp. BE258]|uniref:hypothetical protein n=1 Tax=Rhizobium sp. BE258 TaxID=2817722 RepID=UPI002859A73F|nr:hypothetical protein [Rhizobium sp. BE258]MDR7147068.1 hypothetical protein [Rhizobium sp. BE258]